MNGDGSFLVGGLWVSIRRNGCHLWLILYYKYSKEDDFYFHIHTGCTLTLPSGMKVRHGSVHLVYVTLTKCKLNLPETIYN